MEEKSAKIDKRITKTKRLIRNTFVEILKEKKLSDISVTELSERAEIDRKTFYYHYATPASILEEIENEISAKLEIIFSSEESSDIERIFPLINNLLESDPLYLELGKNSRVMNTISPRLKAILKEIIKRNFAQKTHFSDEKFSVFIEFATSGLLGVYLDYLSGKQEIPLAKVSEYVTEFFFTDWKTLF
ncbi:MAG: TetR/AcrR family transcriptional regulator [Treponema sp.]|nr:TetR/AcrR family transcriptional regulator [Treponema sp.]MBR1403376.1 TetR/AcrR family transcriptional regulator [Treponema sp.]